MSSTETNFVVGDFVVGDLVNVKHKNGTYVGYVYDSKPLSSLDLKLGFARNLKIVNAEYNNLNLREVDSRLCSVVNSVSNPLQEETLLLNFIEDSKHQDFSVGQLVRPKKGVELFYCPEPEIKYKLLSPLTVVNVGEKVTISGNLEVGGPVNIKVSKILLHSL